MSTEFVMCQVTLVQRYREFLARYVTPFTTVEQGNAVDLGCGTGILVEELSKKYPLAFTGVDISSHAWMAWKNNQDLAHHDFILLDVMELCDKPELRHAYDLLVSYSCFHLVKGSTEAKFRLLDYLAKPGAVIAIDALPDIAWNRMIFTLVRTAFRWGLAPWLLKRFGSFIAPNIPKAFLTNLSQLDYQSAINFDNFIDQKYFETAEFKSRFELIRRDIVPQDGFFTGRKLRFCLRKK